MTAKTLDILSRYSTCWASLTAQHRFIDSETNERTIKMFATFAESTPDAFRRENLAGHFTGSALVASPTLDRVLLTHHGKLNLWLQLGGHADGDACLPRVAWREAQEESGLSDFHFVKFPVDSSEVVPFDLDAHRIPARKSEPEHFHYDVRYLLWTDDRAPLGMSDESHDLRWFTLPEARQVTQEPSMLRQFAKLEFIAGRAQAEPEILGGARITEGDFWG